MIAVDEDALVCDLAETYQIYDMYAFDVLLIARLSCGLGEDSRIMKKMSGNPVGTTTQLLAMAVDALNLLVWSKTVDAEKGINLPESVLEKLLRREEKKPQDKEVFDSAEAFEARRRSLIEDMEDK